MFVAFAGGPGNTLVLSAIAMKTLALGHSEVVVRRAIADELVEVQALIQRAFRGATGASSWAHQGEIAADERIALPGLYELLARPNAVLSVAIAGDRLIGTSFVEIGAGGGATIGLLSVDPDLQGRGIGDRLLASAEQQAAQLGARRSEIEVVDYKTRLLGYYERRGYRCTGATRPYPHPIGRNARFLELAKPLDQRAIAALKDPAV